MSAPPVSCTKCGGHMEDGFVVDFTYGGASPAAWVEGAPQKSFWTGLKLSGHAKLAITTYRCTNCGYLESYALPE